MVGRSTELTTGGQYWSFSCANTPINCRIKTVSTGAPWSRFCHRIIDEFIAMPSQKKVATKEKGDVGDEGDEDKRGKRSEGKT